MTRDADASLQAEFTPNTLPVILKNFYAFRAQELVQVSEVNEVVGVQVNEVVKVRGGSG